MNTTYDINKFISDMNEYKQNKNLNDACVLFTSIFKELTDDDYNIINNVNSKAGIIDYLQVLGVFIMNGLNKQVSNPSDTSDISDKLDAISLQLDKIKIQVRKDVSYQTDLINHKINMAVNDIINSNNNIINDVTSMCKTYTYEELYNMKNSGMSWNELVKITGLSKGTIRYRVETYKNKNNIQ